jgi:hypothetical protein
MSFLTLDNLDELRGVLRSFTPEQPEIVDLSSLQDSTKPTVPEFFHVVSRFARSELKPRKGSYVQTLEAYFMVKWKVWFYFNGYSISFKPLSLELQ